MLSPVLSLHSNPGYPDWANPNIYITSDAAGKLPIANPAVGVPCYCWAKVANTGGADANAVKVDFKYDKFGASFNTMDQLTPIGSSLPTKIAAGTTAIVGGAVSWTLNSADHTCLVAVVGDNRDPAPCPAEPVHISDRHIAQFNYNPISISAQELSLYASKWLETYINASTLPGGSSELRVMRVELSALEGILSRLGLASLPTELPAEVKALLERFGGSPNASGGGGAAAGAMPSISLAGGIDHRISVLIQPPVAAESGSGALFAVEHLVEGKAVNGAYILLQIK